MISSKHSLYPSLFWRIWFRLISLFPHLLSGTSFVLENLRDKDISLLLPQAWQACARLKTNKGQNIQMTRLPPCVSIFPNLFSVAQCGIAMYVCTRWMYVYSIHICRSHYMHLYLSVLYTRIHRNTQRYIQRLILLCGATVTSLDQYTVIVLFKQ